MEHNNNCLQLIKNLIILSVLIKKKMLWVDIERESNSTNIFL